MTREAKILIAIMVVIVGGGLFAIFSSSKPTTHSSEALVRQDSHKLGDGKVQVVEFGDYQCPACGQAYPVTKQLISDYQGKITFIFRNFPLPMHPNALPAAEAAEAAGAQGKFWEMHDKLYETQDEWSGVLDPTNAFTHYASDLGIDADKFKQDIIAKKYQDIISKDQSDGYSLGVQGTPTFFVNGKQQSAFDYDSLKNAIDAEL
jgi:protein-disulfide isomerase